jgi:NAD(P)-dependent dehydrogenase (short-subunit alcohol dehydrogenase family)
MAETLAGKVAIITGAGSGIGYATARLFLNEGAKVLAVDLPGKDLSGMFSGEVNVRFAYADVADINAPSLILKAVTEAFGRLDILMNNAGICLPGDAESMTEENWDRTLAVNVTSMFRITQAVLPLMKARGRGRIINLGSIMSEMAGPGLLAYGMSKHAVAGLTKAMAVDLGKYKITANYLQPGSILTAMSAPMMEDKTFREYWEKKAPVGRLGQPEDIASAALFLASDAADFVTGLGFNVDGGAIVNF